MGGDLAGAETRNGLWWYIETVHQHLYGVKTRSNINKYEFKINGQKTDSCPTGLL